MFVCIIFRKSYLELVKKNQKWDKKKFKWPFWCLVHFASSTVVTDTFLFIPCKHKKCNLVIKKIYFQKAFFCKYIYIFQKFCEKKITHTALRNFWKTHNFQKHATKRNLVTNNFTLTNSGSPRHGMKFCPNEIIFAVDFQYQSQNWLQIYQHKKCWSSSQIF